MFISIKETLVFRPTVLHLILATPYTRYALYSLRLILATLTPSLYFHVYTKCFVRKRGKETNLEI